MFRRLFKKQGSVLFVSVLLAVVLMFGGTALFLVSQVKSDRDSKTTEVFNLYTYQSMSKIMSEMLLTRLTEVSATMYYTPLETDDMMFNKLQDSLHKEFVSSSGDWIYDSLIPASLTNIKLNAKVQIEEFPSVYLADDIKQKNSLQIPSISLKISYDTAEYVCHLNKVKITSDFFTNKIVCCFDTADAEVADAKLILR